MDPTYAHYGKDIFVRFNQLDDIDIQNWSLFHVHDFGYNLKNAEASLERGTHFDGTTSYDGNDLATLFTTCNDEMYRKVSQGLQHRAVLQYDKHSCELSLQRVSDPVIDDLIETKHLLKTVIPEMRRSWFADNHEKTGKPLFVTISKEGVVFATDDFFKIVFFYKEMWNTS